MPELPLALIDIFTYKVYYVFSHANDIHFFVLEISMDKLFSTRISGGIFSTLLWVIVLAHLYLPRIKQAEIGNLLINICLAVFVLFSVSRLAYIGLRK